MTYCILNYRIFYMIEKFTIKSLIRACKCIIFMLFIDEISINTTNTIKKISFTTNPTATCFNNSYIT